jgi:hypothetical protein
MSIFTSGVGKEERRFITGSQKIIDQRSGMEQDLAFQW